jgi:subtilisin family serine protease
MTGEGVDFVIMDSGIEVNHPEFQDASGALRVMQLDWFANHSGVTNPYAASGPLGAAFYADTGGHGTHCAGIAAGKTYGWAKNAHIYSLKVLSSGGPDSISVELACDLLKFWHQNKGNNRPTVVNMSFGYSWNIDGWDGAAAGDHGQHWDTFTNQMDVWNFGDPNFGSAMEVNYQVDIGPYSYSQLGRRYSSVDAKIDQLTAAGVHVAIAAGNNSDVQYNYSDDANDNYNDFFSRPSWFGGFHVHYHRGSSPRASTVKGAEMVVSNIGVEIVNNKEVLAGSSGCGEAMDINAPGTNITSSCSTDTSTAAGGSRNVSDYPADPNFKIISLTGTSMAAPQVCGVACLYLQADPTLTPAELKAKILHDAKTGLIYDTVWDQKDLDKYEHIEMTDLSNVLRTYRGLFGGPNKVLYNRFVGDVFVRYVAAGGGG